MKVKLALPPFGPMLPVLKTPALSDVAVWGVTSVLRQATVVPVAIVSGFMPNAAAPAVEAPVPIVTGVLPGVGAGAGAGAGDEAGAGAGVGATGDGELLLLPHAETINAKATRKANFRDDMNTSQIQARDLPRIKSHQGRVSPWQNDGHLK